jgi:hypothetical protein
MTEARDTTVAGSSPIRSGAVDQVVAARRVAVRADVGNRDDGHGAKRRPVTRA